MSTKTIIIASLVVLVFALVAIATYFYIELQKQIVFIDELNLSTLEVDEGFERQTIQYVQPSVEDFNQLDFPETNYNPIEISTTTPESTGVTEAATLNEFTELLTAYEQQFIQVMPQAMAAVQAEAAQGNFFQMFENIKQAQAENEKLKTLTNDLTNASGQLQRDFLSQGNLPPASRQAFGAALTQLNQVLDSTRTITSLFDQTLTASIPSQELLSEIDRTVSITYEQFVQFGILFNEAANTLQ